MNEVGQFVYKHDHRVVGLCLPRAIAILTYIKVVCFNFNVLTACSHHTDPMEGAS